MTIFYYHYYSLLFIVIQEFWVIIDKVRSISYWEKFYNLFMKFINIM